MCRVKSPQNGRKELAETKRNQNELKQNEECAWLTEKKCKCLGGGQVKREGEETFAHCAQKLENANKCKLAIFISLSPRGFFLLLASSFFLALLLRCHVTNSSREVCSFHPLSLSPMSPFLRVCLCCQATLIQKYFGRWHLKCHIYMAFLCGPMSATSPDFLYSPPPPSVPVVCCGILKRAISLRTFLHNGHV